MRSTLGVGPGLRPTTTCVTRQDHALLLPLGNQLAGFATKVDGLRQAIANDRLKLVYQPQTQTVDGALYGVEALARWHDPDLGQVPPSKFIPLAEEVGLIEQIGLWSIREACRQMAAWRDAGLDVPCVAVNLSPLNFPRMRPRRRACVRINGRAVANNKKAISSEVHAPLHNYYKRDATVVSSEVENPVGETLR